MHPPNPAVGLIRDMWFDPASLQHFPASLLSEGVWLGDSAPVDSCSVANEIDGGVDNDDQNDGSKANIPDGTSIATMTSRTSAGLERLPNEVLLHVLGFLDVSDLLATSRLQSNHLLRSLSLAPILHHYRLQRTRQILPPLLSSPTRPTIADLISRSIFLTHTSIVSRRLAWSLVSIRLSRRLAARPSAEALVQRCVLPKECVPGMSSVHIAPALVAKRKAIEKEKVKDGLRRWIAAKWRGESWRSNTPSLRTFIAGANRDVLLFGPRRKWCNFWAFLGRPYECFMYDDSEA
ncbi:F-box domain, cyclin-like protein [Metarhizium album ARSEF 1941]|uniref:F-box domain, cyclin-like protein n=1 Tax=Metarhizium album (strain ARSEF 1941) TaxID=1081103 RepID=A0A0B2WQG7_METAS|nr:F-box domain, cyclin-like protein [Metarhizium album ARSEF 1941]KHN95889.1 F-box domain, cyclin-like protein [Metarhizium album ARSEF 1941]